MNQCPFCHIAFSRRDALLRHQRNVHSGNGVEEENNRLNTDMTFQHPFTTDVSGPSGSGKTRWTKQLLLSSLIQPSPQRIIYCYGQWQPLYADLKRSLPRIEFIKGISDQLDDQDFIDGTERLLIVFDDLMTEAKCDQRIADLFTKGSHHRNMSVIYLTQNVFPQGKACRDIALNTQYMVLFNNPIDRQQVATLARRMYPSSSGRFLKRFQEAVQKPYGYLVVDLKADTSEHERLKSDIFDLQGGGSASIKRKLHQQSHGGADKEEEEEENHPAGPPGVREVASPPTKMRKITREDTDDESRDKEDDDNASLEGLGDFREMGSSNHEKCPASTENGESCFLRELVIPRVRETFYPQLKLDAIERYPECSSRLAERKMINDKLPELRKTARERLGKMLLSFYYLDQCPLYASIMDTAQRLRHTSHLPIHLAIREAIRIRKPDLNGVLIEEKSEETSDIEESDEDNEVEDEEEEEKEEEEEGVEEEEGEK